MNADGAAINWLWLADAPARDGALVVANGDVDWRVPLRRHYAEVAAHPVDAMRATLHAIVGGLGTRPILPFADGAFDLVVLPGFVGGWHLLAGRRAWRDARAATIAECRRVLRARGLLVVSGRNPQWYGRSHGRGLAPECATIASMKVGRLKNNVRTHIPSVMDVGLPVVMRDAGFHDVRAFLLEPSDLAPQIIVPADRAAVLAYERLERSYRGRVPRLLATLGLQALAYPARLFMAAA